MYKVIIICLMIFGCNSSPGPAAELESLCNNNKNCRVASVDEGHQINTSIAQKRLVERVSEEPASQCANSDRAYVIGLKLKQSRFSLDIGQHIKDAANAVEFELPVSKEFYDKVSVGDQLLDDFRVGSLLLSGSFSNWKITIKSKRIEKLR